MSVQKYEFDTISKLTAWLAGHVKEGGAYTIVPYFGHVAVENSGFTLYHDGYALTESEPANWATNYNDYYTKQDGVYVKNAYESKPYWAANTYYAAPSAPMMQFGKIGGSYYKCKLKKSKTGTAIEKSPSSSATEPNKIVVYECDGGVLIQMSCGTSYAYEFMFTKTNNNETAIILAMTESAGSVPDANKYTDVESIAWGDNELSDKKVSFIKQEQDQTKLVPFTTYAKVNTRSYTPTAFYAPVGQFYDLKKGTVMYDDKYYVTNGFWYIEDKLVDAGGAE